MRKQHTKVICAAQLAVGLAALGLASAALDRIGNRGLFSFIKGGDTESRPPNLGNHSENNNPRNEFCEQIQLIGCLA